MADISSQTTLIFIANTFICSVQVAICELLVVPCEEVSIFSRRNHCFVLYFCLCDVNESGFEFLKIKMYIYKIFAILSRFRDYKFECLLIPSLADPAHVSKFGWFHADSLSTEYNIIAINICVDNWMQRSYLLVLNLKKPFRINIAIIATEMEPVDFLIFMQFLWYCFWLLFIVIVARKIHMDKSFIVRNNFSKSFGRRRLAVT